MQLYIPLECVNFYFYIQGSTAEFSDHLASQVNLKVLSIGKRWLICSEGLHTVYLYALLQMSMNAFVCLCSTYWGHSNNK